jgi:hypothetical protein
VSLTLVPYNSNGLVYTNGFLFPDGSFKPSPPSFTSEFRVHSDNDTRVYAFARELTPAYLDLELAVLEPSVVAKFRAREETSHTRATNYLADQIGRTHLFRQRIAVKAGSAPPD